MWPQEKTGAERFRFGYLKVGRKLRRKGKGDSDVNVAAGRQRYEDNRCCRGHVTVPKRWVLRAKSAAF